MYASLGLLLSCSSLPEYARPVGEVIEASAYRATDTIPYRQLSRDDFRGSSAPEHVRAHSAEIGAATCVSIAPTTSTVSPDIEVDPASGGFSARAPDLKFGAVMDRECSWWNPEQNAPGDYVLQHEQIHFAIIEVEARRLDAQVGKLQGRGGSPNSATEDLQNAIEAAVQDSMSRALKRSLQFDHDTSGSYEPKRQSRWDAKLHTELGPLD